MESKTKNRKTRQQIEAMTARAFDGMALAAGEDAIVEMKDGWFNASYQVRLADGREVVLKIAPPAGSEVLTYESNIMTTEVASMRLVRGNAAVPVPEIYSFDDARDLCDSPYFFMEKVVGDNLEHAKVGMAPEARAAIDRQIGEIIRAVNGFTGTYFGYEGNPKLRANTWREAFISIMDSVLDDGARKDVVYDFSPDEIRATVQRHGAALDEIATPCLVHWDAWDPNWFVRDGKVAGIIDFERALWAEPLMEAQFRNFGGPEINDAMRGYGKTTYTFAEKERCQLYQLHLALVMNTECYYRNYDTDEVMNDSRKYMRSAMEWLQAN
jgi:aminoglycoside phosphotransferase (APT) family kinase protein